MNFSLLHYFLLQGYDSIPREIPDPKAKKVSSAGFNVHCLNVTHVMDDVLKLIFLRCGYSEKALFFSFINQFFTPWQ